MKDPEELKKLKKRAMAGTVALATAAGILVSSAVKDPADLVNGEDPFQSPAPIVEVVSDLPENPEDGDEDETTMEEEKKRGGLKNRIRSFLLSRSPAVRVLVCLPLWALGWAVTGLTSALGTVLSPVGGTILHVLLTAGILLALLVGTIKCIAPDTPIKKILTKKNICLSVIAAAAAELALVLVQLFAPEGETITRLIRAALTLIAVLAVCTPAAIRAAKKEKAALRT